MYHAVLYYNSLWHKTCFSFREFHSQHMRPLRDLKEKDMPPVINQELCTGCGTCADICPMNVFEHDSPGLRPGSFMAKSAGTATPVCWTARKRR